MTFTAGMRGARARYCSDYYMYLNCVWFDVVDCHKTGVHVVMFRCVQFSPVTASYANCHSFITERF